MNVIYKYPLILERVQSIRLPRTARFLSVQNQDSVPTLWAIIDPDEPLSDCRVEIIGTGWKLESIPVNPSLRYLGTVQIDVFVWHVFGEFICHA